MRWSSVYKSLILSSQWLAVPLNPETASIKMQAPMIHAGIAQGV
jgi:hypothetical protein